VKRLAAYGEPVEGTPFGRYRLIELLGRGGIGEVWRAHDTAIDRMAALKMLLPHFAQSRHGVIFQTTPTLLPPSSDGRSGGSHGGSVGGKVRAVDEQRPYAPLQRRRSPRPEN